MPLLCLFLILLNAGPAIGDTRLSIRVTDPLPEEYSLVLKQDIGAGSLLRLQADSIQQFNHFSILEVSVAGHVLKEVHHGSDEELRKDWNWFIATLPMVTVVTAEPLRAGDRIDIRTKNNRQNQANPGVSSYSGLNWSIRFVQVDDIRAVDAKPVSETVTIEFVPGEPVGLEAYLKPDGRLLVTPCDVFGNPARRAGMGISVNDGSRIHTARLDDAVPTVLTLSPSVERVEVRDAFDRCALSNALPIALDGTPVWFGDFHWHTLVSGDGQRDPEKAMRAARDELGLDFAGPSDHIAADGDYHNRFDLHVSDLTGLVGRFESPGTFAVITGAERSTRHGHANIYADSDEIWAQVTGKCAASGMNRQVNTFPHQEIQKILPAGHAFYVPHHTNVDSFVEGGVTSAVDGLPLWYAMSFPLPADRDFVRLFEMCQLRGCFETEELCPEWGVRYGGFGASARSALGRGYHIGFTGGSDNHCGWPTRAPGKTVGLTGVVSAQLDRKSIFDALYARRCYATTGARIVADAALNGYPIGSELKLNPGEARIFEIMIKGTAPIEKVQVISAGTVLADLPVKGASLDFSCEWQDDRPGRPLDDTYYYVRARQADGHCVWLSPWWIDLPE